MVFEKNLEKIDEIVRDLEEGELSLNKSVEKFEEGVKLIKECYKEIETAELKIETIIRENSDVINGTSKK